MNEISIMMLRYFAGCLAILITQAVALCAFMGIGLAFRRASGPGKPSPRDLVAAMWTGLSLVIVGLILWNFVAPINDWASCVVLVVGFAGVAMARRDVVDAIRPLPRWFWGWGFVAGFWLANLALAASGSWDSGLYHVQGVKWATTFPVVPGLANLHGPLGFNNSSFLFFGMLDSGPWEGHAGHIGNGMILWLLVVQSLTGVYRWLNEGTKARGAALFDAMMLAPAVSMALSGPLAISSFTTDIAPNALVIAAASQIFGLLIFAATTRDEKNHALTSALVMLAAMVTLKSSSGVFAVSAAVLLFAFVWREVGKSKMTWKPLLIGGSLAAVAAIAWMARGVILTGYPLFPATVFGFPVDWRVPVIQGEAELANAEYTERAFAFEIGEAWYADVFDEPYIIVIPVCLLAWAALSWIFLRKSASRPNPWPLALVGAAGIALATWLLTVPSLRYAGGFWWVAAGTGCGWVFGRGQAETRSALPRIAFVVTLAIGVLAPVVQPWVLALRRDEPLSRIVTANFVPPGKEHLFHSRDERPKLKPYTTQSGLVLNLAAGKCWDAPLPCTPNPSPVLRLRVPGRLAQGFTVDGKWRMEHFPYSWRRDWFRAWAARRSVGEGAQGQRKKAPQLAP